MNTGVKRLAVLLGCVGAVAHLGFMTVYTEFFTEMDQTLTVWVEVTLVTAAFFLIPFGLVHGIAWVIRGFRLQARNGEQGPAEDKTAKPR